MTSETQILLVRNIYLKCRERYYNHDFRFMLSALSAKNPKYYCAVQEYICTIMNTAENAILREEVSRALKYVICFRYSMNLLEKRMNTDCNRYWSYLSIK